LASCPARQGQQRSLRSRQPAAGSRPEADRVLSGIIAPLVRRDPAELCGQICVGSAGECV